MIVSSIIYPIDTTRMGMIANFKKDTLELKRIQKIERLGS